jgi:malonyl-CoA/methylmalonyl-CoA synthetase
MLLSSTKFESKAEDVIKEGLQATPKHVKLEKLTARQHQEKVKLEGPTDGEGGMMLYTSGTTNRPVSAPHPHLTS